MISFRKQHNLRRRGGKRRWLCRYHTASCSYVILIGYVLTMSLISYHEHSIYYLNVDAAELNKHSSVPPSIPDLSSSRNQYMNDHIHQERQQQMVELTKIAPILGESAIVDKSTGRVFWQGGRQSLFESTVGHSYLSNAEGVARHVRATILSCVLWIALLRTIADRLYGTLSTYIISLSNGSKPSYFANAMHVLRSVSVTSRRERVWRVFVVLAHATLTCVLFFPGFSRQVILTCIVLYLIESYTCSTRVYLGNASTASTVDDYLDGMRQQPPQVTWKIRFFHYEKRRWLHILLLLDLWKMIINFISSTKAFSRDDTFVVSSEDALYGAASGTDNDESFMQPESETSSSNKESTVFPRKVISYEASCPYLFQSCEDKTVSGIWKQARSSTSLLTPFTKMSFSKVLLFTDTKTRKDYFLQQSRFIKEEGQKDEFAELSTVIEVPGFQPKLLAVKDLPNVKAYTKLLFSLKFFWLFTLLGLTVPFRVWFRDHCDELKVSIIKETSATSPKTKKHKSAAATTSSSGWMPKFTSLWRDSTSDVPADDDSEKKVDNIQDNHDAKVSNEVRVEDTSIADESNTNLTASVISADDDEKTNHGGNDEENAQVEEAPIDAVKASWLSQLTSLLRESSNTTTMSEAEVSVQDSDECEDKKSTGVDIEEESVQDDESTNTTSTSCPSVDKKENIEDISDH